jgi:RNA polymerase sigma factor, sigma-70 family
MLLPFGIHRDLLSGIDWLAGGEEMISAAAILMLSSMLYSLRLSSGSFPKPLSAKEEQEYLEKAAAGDLEARNILIERNLRLVAHIMKKYYAQTSDQEDLISIGTIGLIKAVSTFDAGKGIRLATYAARCVENEILMHFRSQRKSASDVSLSDYIETGKDGTALSLMDVVCQDDDMFDRISSREDVRLLRQYMGEVLDDREQKVLTLRYGLDGKEPLPQREVAQQCNISRSYISRIEKKALEKLRSAFEGKREDG